MHSIFMRGTAALFAVAASAPALADHGIAGGGVSGGGPIITLEAGALPAGKVAAGLSFRLTQPDAYSNTELIALAARHIDAHTTDYNLGATASLAYGVTDRFMLTAALPYVRRDNLREGAHSHAGGVVTNSVEELGTVSGIGDLSLMGQYVLARDHGRGWAIAALAGVKLPTGSTHHTDPSGDRLETEHQPGTGSWDPLFGLAASKAAGRWSFHAGAQYQVSTSGAQDTRLGDRINLTGAAVYLVSGEVPGTDEHESEPHRDPPSWSVMLEPSYEWEGRQEIAGSFEEASGAKVLWLSPGVRFGTPAGWSAALSAGRAVVAGCRAHASQQPIAGHRASGDRLLAQAPSNEAMMGQGPVPPAPHSWASRASEPRTRCSSAIRASSSAMRARAMSRARGRSWLLSRRSSSAISASVKPAACAERINRSLRASSSP